MDPTRSIAASATPEVSPEPQTGAVSPDGTGRPGNSWTFRDPRVREFILLCAPALLLGFVLRLLMTWQMPYGYMQFDSADFLTTAHRLLSKHQFLIHQKRTFLVPVLYALPFYLKIPALIVIPLAQHLLGLGIVLMSGLLVRLWFPAWRWAIVPVTLLMAANPNLLWFEHTLMSESVYLFCIFALALAATLFTGQPTGRRFAFLLVALFFTAGARPEGRLLLGFAFLLIVLVEWGRWRILALRLACLVALAIPTLRLTHTGQSGQLLYATLLPLAPDESKVDPEFGRIVRPYRDQIRAKRNQDIELQGREQKLTELTGEYLQSKGIRNPDTNSLCQKLAVEAALNQPFQLPVIAGRKFLRSNNSPTSIGYYEPKLQKKLNVGFNRKGLLDVLSRGLVGRELKDEGAVADFVREHYHPLAWFPFFDRNWQRLTIGLRDDEEVPGSEPPPHLAPFFALGLVGFAIAIVAGRPFRKFHLAWILSLGGLWFAVELAGVVNARYRFIFEPFCLLYIALGVSIVGAGIARKAKGATPRKSG